LRVCGSLVSLIGLGQLQQTAPLMALLNDSAASSSGKSAKKSTALPLSIA
jgi:hypothetical protein